LPDWLKFTNALLRLEQLPRDWALKVLVLQQPLASARAPLTALVPEHTYVRLGKHRLGGLSKQQGSGNGQCVVDRQTPDMQQTNKVGRAHGLLVAACELAIERLDCHPINDARLIACLALIEQKLLSLPKREAAILVADT
jgi:hypothetical protein